MLPSTCKKKREPTVTTVDVRITRVGRNDRLDLHNGMWGPATTVLHSFYQGCVDGTITGSWSPAHVDAVTNGVIVRAALIQIDDFDKTYHRDGDEERLAEFVNRIQDEAEYEIHALEV
jgi:hypothetical protein